MAYFLTFALLATLLAVLVIRTIAVRVKQAKKEKLRLKEREHRKEKEDELLEQVAELRKRRQNRVADAVKEDPVRAAKVLRTMMRGKTGKDGYQ